MRLLFRAINAELESNEKMGIVGFRNMQTWKSTEVNQHRRKKTFYEPKNPDVWKGRDSEQTSSSGILEKDSTLASFLKKAMGGLWATRPE